MTVLKVNGQTHDVEADPGTPLLYVLRDDLGLNGAKYGCGFGQCGAFVCGSHDDWKSHLRSGALAVAFCFAVD